MAKVFMFRHQHHGVVTTHVFLKPPTPAQIAPLIIECERIHGREGWGTVTEAELISDEVPSFPRDDKRGVSNDGAAQASTVQAVGHVGSADPE